VLHRLAVLIVLVLTVGACAEEPAAQPDGAATPDAAAEDAGPASAGEPEEEANAAGDGLTAVTTVFPLADMAQRIAPGADVTLLTAGGQDPHDLELSPTDRALLESADVVLYMGDIDFQPQVESAVRAATGEVVAVADITGSAALLDVDGHSHDERDGHAHDEDDAHPHEEDDSHADDEDAVDPHLWFDPAVMAEVAEEIGESFAAADEANAEAYRENAQSLHDELAGLDDELDQLLSDCTHQVAMVSHEAYAYLLEPRDLEQEGISGAGGHGQASPQRLAELTERIQEEDIPAVLAEPLEGRADAEALASEAGVPMLEIDPLEIGTEDLLATGYVDALRAQAQTFAEALGCG
jgi:zinc transport system substrate-binding protein